ncbi:MAG: HAD family phosphatase [Clostridiales bacterium]|nr:HAD family phosphatase [Clostridiales bacterium]
MQTTPTIRLISVDMDGTLLNPKGRVTSGNLQAIRAAQQAGIIFSVATGRFYENASIGIKDMGLNCPVISTNGGKIAAAPFGEVIASHKMSADSALAVMRQLDELEAGYYVFSDGLVGVRLPHDRHHSQVEFGDDRMLHETNTRYLNGHDACRDAIHRGIYKFYVHTFGDRDRLQHVRRALQGIPDTVLTHSSETNIEIMPPGVDKGSGIRELAAYLNIPVSQVMAIGDQDNDLPMLKAAGFGVAMGNASQDVKRQADAITSTNAEDGVAQAILRYALPSSGGQA